MSAPAAPWRTGLVLLVISMVAAACGASEPDGTWADAVETGDLELAQALASAGADPEEPEHQGLTPLMRAVARDDGPMVEVLLDAGADPGATGLGGIAAVHVAAQTDAAASLAVLVRAGADVETRSANGMNALHHAADLGSTEVIAYLDGIGIDLDSQSEVVTQGHGYPRDTGPTALAIAVRAGRTEAVTALVDHGAAVDEPSSAGVTPLLTAVFSGQSPELVAVLLDAGADSGAEASCERGCSADADDALEWARELGRDDLVPLLEAETGCECGEGVVD